jgi:hypothetical protein
MRRLLAAGLGCVMLLMPAAAQTPSLEYAVKAAYLTKFIPFIQWPEAAFASPAAPVTICVLGSDPFGASLDKAAAGGAKSVDRPIAVRRLAELDPAASCHILFIGGGDPAVTDGALEAMKGRAVVTVTDTDAEPRGVISFAVVGNRVRFDVDDSLAAQGGLVVSSKLLGLARSVKQRSPQ